MNYGSALLIMQKENMSKEWTVFDVTSVVFSFVLVWLDYLLYSVISRLTNDPGAVVILLLAGIFIVTGILVAFSALSKRKVLFLVLTTIFGVAPLVYFFTSFFS